MDIKDIKDKKILILGFGREGRDTFLFLRKMFPGKIFGIADKSPDIPNLPKQHAPFVALHLGETYLNAIGEYEIIVKTPGIPLKTLTPLLKKSHKVTNQTELFFSACQGTIIGVTGTKGKSTTSSLIHKVLTDAGYKTKLLGNIGTPALSFLKNHSPEDIFVYELSSFQLETMRQSPHIAVLLNLYEEHLDHHRGMAEYKKAKGNIATYQGPADFLLYNEQDPFCSAIAKKSKAQTIPFRATSKKRGALFLASPEPAILVGKLFGIPQKKIIQSIETFKPLPHRLEPAGVWQGIEFINDSLATIPEATIGALESLKGKIGALITGGFDRGVSYKRLASYLENSKIPALILFPDTGKKIIQLMKRPPQHFFAGSMKEAVQLCFANTPKGKICLLSPAASSFNMFKDYADRGDQFKKWVAVYGKKTA
ncbi:MAG: UDP-N-acetylmuramoyl-L-alanine--D-glutamate ligase [Candidatus Wildermuthbacteria bacterium]|nr:UDP-N-acetylmuramoyl-L-alanine--D-glutamate ligase [Candidatus Wildermuthbacteria bacterium]